MARLTRTQKYAQLREQIDIDNEKSTTTSQLEGFEKRLDNLQQTLSPRTENTINPTVTQTVSAPAVENTYTAPVKTEVKETAPVTKPAEESKYTWDTFENEFKVDLDSILGDWKIDDLFGNNTTEEKPAEPVETKPVETAPVDTTPVTPVETVVETVVETPVETVVETPVETVVETVTQPVETVIETATETVVETPVETEVQPEETVVETVAPVEVETAAVEEITVEDTKVEEITVEDTEVEETVIETPVETVVETVTQPVETVVETPAEPETADYMDNFKVEEGDNSDSGFDFFDEETVNLMDETIAEVESYNEATGKLNIIDITNSLVDEVRHSQETELDADEVEPETVETSNEDEEFTNTVSMEISKIMNEIPEETATEPVKKEETFEHPVLAKTLEDTDDGVEIKNLKEIDIEPVRDATISSTIPFIVSNDDDEDEEEYEDEEEGSNTILNVILIILIIILVAVLGLIVFYILKTKGII